MATPDQPVLSPPSMTTIAPLSSRRFDGLATAETLVIMDDGEEVPALPFDSHQFDQQPMDRLVETYAGIRRSIKGSGDHHKSGNTTLEAERIFEAFIKKLSFTISV